MNISKDTQKILTASQGNDARHKAPCALRHLSLRVTINIGHTTAAKQSSTIMYELLSN